ncbi:MAG: DUF4160 domain-containing protein [Pyrinomonadaceae bacterium]|nr:DUF4160 domain-containing protein [Pyrinomonadaceae bacterium]
MPTISMFFGIVIRMYFGPKEHNPPHIHAVYQGAEAIFSVSEGQKSSGDFPARQSKLVEAWIEIHRDELLANWELCQNGEVPFAIEPLR